MANYLGYGLKDLGATISGIGDSLYRQRMYSQERADKLKMYEEEQARQAKKDEQDAITAELTRKAAQGTIDKNALELEQSKAEAERSTAIRNLLRQEAESRNLRNMASGLNAKGLESFARSAQKAGSTGMASTADDMALKREQAITDSLSKTTGPITKDMMAEAEATAEPNAMDVQGLKSKAESEAPDMGAKDYAMKYAEYSDTPELQNFLKNIGGGAGGSAYKNKGMMIDDLMNDKAKNDEMRQKMLDIVEMRNKNGFYASDEEYNAEKFNAENYPAVMAVFPDALRSPEMLRTIELNKKRQETPILVDRSGKTSEASVIGGAKGETKVPEVTGDTGTSGTPDQRKYAKFAAEQENANDIIDDLEAKKFDPRGLALKIKQSVDSKGNFVLSTLMNKGITPEEQSYFNAMAVFIDPEARLRSGAVINAGELAKYAVQWMAQPFESKEQVKQKRNLRYNTIEQNKANAGQAYYDLYSKAVKKGVEEKEKKFIEKKTKAEESETNTTQQSNAVSDLDLIRSRRKVIGK